MLPPKSKFLHCMRESQYLELALRDGLMLTDHTVNFDCFTRPEEHKRLREEIWPFLENKLAQLGHTWGTLDEETRSIILVASGTITGLIPMLCFSEYPTGKRIPDELKSMFGTYGVVPNTEWLMRNNIDRVLYIGRSSPASYQLFRNVTIMKLGSLHISPQNGKPVLDTNVMKAVLDFFPYVEVRDNISEAEWRIVGNHGFFGGGSDRGKRIPITMDDLKYVFVPKAEEVMRFQMLVDELADKQNCLGKPKVAVFPEVIPD